MNRRIAQGAIAVAVLGGGLASGELVAQATASPAPHAVAQSAGSGSSLMDKIPAQVQVMGPGGVIAGTVPRSDLIGAPPNGAPGTPTSAANVPGASIVLEGLPGYPVTDNGQLVGYWVGPLGFITIAAAESQGATPATGQGPVGTAS
jgi:hypothetical protein